MGKLLAQEEVLVNGFVKDSIDNPIIAASVILINQHGAGIIFSKTSENGAFSFNFKNQTENLSLKVTALGYQSLILPINKKAEQSFNIKLKSNSFKLQEVTINSQVKISLASDTLKYNLQAFKDRNDSVIADLISRLPGIQIDENGGISYNGKHISNVYIDGDNLLDGRYKMATNNIPVNAVEQVQVIERDQPIKALNGYISSDNISLNLKLTDSARTMTLNTGYIGSGNKVYSAELNNLLFKKKVKSINNVKANNVGENLQAEQANVGVSFNDEISIRKPANLLSMESETVPTLGDKYYLMNNDYSASINTLFKLNSDWAIRLNLSTLQLKRKYNYYSRINYFIGNTDTIIYEEVQNSIYKLNHWHGEALIEKNSKSIYLKSTTKLILPKWERNGDTYQNLSFFQQSQPTFYKSLSNETNLVRAIGQNQLLQYNSLLQYYKINESLKITPGIYKNLVNDGLDYVMLGQDLFNRTIFVNQSVTFKTKKNWCVLSISAGISYEENHFNSDLIKTDSANVLSTVGLKFKNKLDFNNFGTFGKIAAIFPIKQATISIEAVPTFTMISYGHSENPGKDVYNYFRVNPVVDFKTRLGKYNELNLRIAQQTSYGQLNDIYDGTILINYRQLNYNDTSLPKTDINSFNARYSYRKPIKMLFFNLNFSYSGSEQNFINSYIIDSALTKSIAINFKNKRNQYIINGNFSKYLFPLSINFSARSSFNLQTGFSFYNDEITPFRAYQTNIGITFRKKLLSTINISIFGDLNEVINNQKTISNGHLSNKIQSKKLKAELQQNLSEEISFSLTYNFNNYRQSLRQEISNQFFDLNVKYAPGKWKSFFELQCINLMNKNLYSQVNSSANQQSIYEMPLRKRTILVKYIFTF
ncbi:hypothetical protein QWY86_19415 [Pedobacter aquatilis]|uniref:hypothetical protein n=1 Tax=Pedobacter aquatilis TaxID=351343 RepID=UPI0025B613F3|nr:hypothetical protein [Pedobacter aquatilis]MDN3588858.1 hypothetical protein [Pedobacter aquatilis]